MAFTKKDREEVEYNIILFMDQLDKTKINSEYLQKKWSNMSEAQFWKWFEKDLPLQLQTREWEIRPNSKDQQDAAKVLGIPLLSKICTPHFYVNKNGVPVNTKDSLRMVLNYKKVQQFLTHKNKVSLNINDRDIKGRLGNDDKGAATSDKEMESLAIASLYNTMEEFGSFRADAMNAKSQAYNTIATTGMLSNKDYQLTKDDSLARNMISAYLMACHISTNLVNEDGYTPYTLKERQRAVQRLS